MRVSCMRPLPLQALHVSSSVPGFAPFPLQNVQVETFAMSTVRAVPKILLYGHDFCWTDDSEFYAGAAQPDLAEQRIKTEADAGTVLTMPDSRGRTVKTTGSLLAFASWYSEIARTMPGLLESRTPTTILSLGGTPT